LKSKILALTIMSSLFSILIGISLFFDHLYYQSQFIKHIFNNTFLGNYSFGASKSLFSLSVAHSLLVLLIKALPFFVVIYFGLLFFWNDFRRDKKVVSLLVITVFLVFIYTYVKSITVGYQDKYLSCHIHFLLTTCNW